MTDATVARLGQINHTGDAFALFLKVFAGEVLTAFDTKVATLDKHVIRSITSGKSAQFPVMGELKAKYHKVGTEILGQESSHNERIITIDDLLISDAFIANIDDAMNHYEVRSEYTKQMGRVLANTFDQHTLRVGVQAANETTPIITAMTKRIGKKVHEAGLDKDSNKLIEAIFKAAANFDDKDVPEDDRFVFVNPTTYYMLAQNTKIMNRDWGGMGTYATADVIKIADMTIVKTNNLPIVNESSITATTAGTDVATSDGRIQKYSVDDASKLVALCWHRSAVGTVKLLDLALEHEYQINRQGWLFVAKYAVGHDKLRSESACIITSEA